ncbi:unnamed protein product [Symbiodinium sp. CCMP2592]|nr:unnamed protein product [Symbiodinium sp. CCMP2592]
MADASGYVWNKYYNRYVLKTSENKRKKSTPAGQNRQTNQELQEELQEQRAESEEELQEQRAESEAYKRQAGKAEELQAQLLSQLQTTDGYRIANLAEARTAICEKDNALMAKALSDQKAEMASDAKEKIERKMNDMVKRELMQEASWKEEKKTMQAALQDELKCHEETVRGLEAKDEAKTTELRALQREMSTELQSFRQLDRDAAVLRSDKARLLEANQRRRNEHQALRAEHEDRASDLREELAEKDKRLRGMAEAQESRIATMGRIEESVQEMEHHTMDLLATKIKLEEEVQERLAELQVGRSEVFRDLLRVKKERTRSLRERAQALQLSRDFLEDAALRSQLRAETASQEMEATEKTAAEFQAEQDMEIQSLRASLKTAEFEEELIRTALRQQLLATSQRSPFSPIPTTSRLPTEFEAAPTSPAPVPTEVPSEEDP